MYKTLNKGLWTLTLITGLLMMGTVDMAQAQSEDGPSSLTETYRDWIVRCVTPAAPEGQAAVRVCEMTQELRHQESGQRVLAAALQPTEAGGASLTLVAPFGLLLEEGLSIAVDDKALTKAGFRTCLPGGCVSVITLDQAGVDRLAAGDAATVQMRDTSNQDISLTVSLAGFTAAWNRLSGL